MIAMWKNWRRHCKYQSVPKVQCCPQWVFPQHKFLFSWGWGIPRPQYRPRRDAHLDWQSWLEPWKKCPGLLLPPNAWGHPAQPPAPSQHFRPLFLKGRVILPRLAPRREAKAGHLFFKVPAGNFSCNISFISWIMVETDVSTTFDNFFCLFSHKFKFSCSNEKRSDFFFPLDPENSHQTLINQVRWSLRLTWKFTPTVNFDWPHRSPPLLCGIPWEEIFNNERTKNKFQKRKNNEQLKPYFQSGSGSFFLWSDIYSRRNKNKFVPPCYNFLLPGRFQSLKVNEKKNHISIVIKHLFLYDTWSMHTCVARITQ